MALFLSKGFSQQNERIFCHINVEVCVAIWLWRLGPPGRLVSRPFSSQRKNIPPWCLNHKWSITVSILPKHPYLQWVLVRLFSDQAYTHIITKHCHCGLEWGILDHVGLLFPAKFCYFVDQPTNFSRFSNCDVGKTS